MATIKWEYTLALIFALSSVVLLALIVVQAHYAENMKAELLHEIENVESAGFSLQDIPDLPLSNDTLDEYSELVERPLFFNGRLPIIVSDDDKADQPEAEQQKLEDLTIKLIGIIKTPDSAYALFYDPKAKPDESKFKRFKQGDDIDGRTLKEIKSDRVILSSVTGSEEIPLTKPRMHKKAHKRKKSARRTNPFNRKMKK